MRAALAERLRARWPWLGLPLAFARLAPQIWAQLADDDGVTARPLVACVVVVSPVKQLTAVLGDPLDPIDESELRRMSLYWSESGRRAIYEVIASMGRGRDWGPPLTACPLCGVGYLAGGRPACACASTPSGSGVER